MIRILALAAFLASTLPAHAAVEHEERICLSRTVENVHGWLVNYAGYKNLDDRLRREVPVSMGPISTTLSLQLANMVESSVTGGFRNDATGTDGYVWVMLRPYNVSNPVLYPRFLIRCSSAWNDPANHVSFDHRCDIVSRNRPAAGAPLTDRHNFSLSGFEARVEATADPSAVAAAGCAAGSTALHYWFRLTPNAEEVMQIKTAALMGAERFETVRDFIRDIFGDDGSPFYNWYYQEFYRAWAAAIPNN